jgi:cytochrome b561
VDAAANENRPQTSAGKPAGRFDTVTIAFHWLNMLLVAGQFLAAWLIDRLPDHAGMLTIHRSLGIVIWAVVTFRLIWRKNWAQLPPFPTSMPSWQRHAATANEYALYSLLLLQPLTGLGMSLLRGQPLQLGLWQVPALLAPDKPLAHTIHGVHQWGALALLALIGLHAAAGLFHGLVRKDGVFQRMTP